MGLFLRPEKPAMEEGCMRDVEGVLGKISDGSLGDARGMHSCVAGIVGEGEARGRAVGAFARLSVDVNPAIQLGSGIGGDAEAKGPAQRDKARDRLAATFSVESPAVVGAFDLAGAHLAHREGSVAVRA